MLNQALKAVALFAIAATCNAAPSCWPTPSIAVGGSLPASVSTNAVYLVWKCPDGSMPALVGSVDEARLWVTKWITGLNEAEASVAWTGAGSLTPEESKFARSVRVDYFGVSPTSLDGIAYKRRENGDGTFTYVRFGKVATDTVCSRSGPAGSYMPIQRTAITRDSQLALYPPQAYGLCG